MVFVIEINEDISTNNIFWTELIRTIYNSFEIEYVINKGRKYMNYSNEWYDAIEIRNKLEQNGIKICHKDHECTGYRSEECNLKSKINKRNVNFDEIKYVFDGKFKFDEARFEDEWNSAFDLDPDEDCDIKNLISDTNKEHVQSKKEIKKILFLIEETNKNIDISKIKFVSDNKIKIKNDQGINKDHRGSDHMIIKLPFISCVSLEKEFTLENLITACTNIKSHKFDLWYELFCGSNCELVGDELIIDVDFDHGS